MTDTAKNDRRISKATASAYPDERESLIHRDAIKNIEVSIAPDSSPQGIAAHFFLAAAKPDMRNAKILQMNARGEISLSGSLTNIHMSDPISAKAVAAASPTAQPKTDAVGTPIASGDFAELARGFLLFLFEDLAFIKSSSVKFFNIFICTACLG